MLHCSISVKIRQSKWIHQTGASFMAKKALEKRVQMALFRQHPIKAALVNFISVMELTGHVSQMPTQSP
ncbi:hypothetical protein HY29_09570 [Hyphomonas beringensis]|uniref:Uncharacterized protein n=1 Tax=Hyphomonas beringensis TaxID=1280946 RepID=A0A062UI94_9PROT|nr:hypothetical protein HY29_09570 [Hyphomonas beringensis]